MKNLTKKIALLAIPLLALSCSEAEQEKSLKSVTVVEVAKATPELSSFVEALEITGLTATFEAAGSSTVFAPNNDAFAAFVNNYGALDLDDFNTKYPGLLEKILKYHVLSSRTLTTTMTDGQSLTTLFGDTVTVNIETYTDPVTNVVTNTISLTDKDTTDADFNLNPITSNDNVDSTIIARDVNCSNATVQLIDSVLIPNTTL